MRKISSDDFEAAMYALDKIRASSSAWLGAVDGSYGAWCVDRFGHVYNINYQYVDYVIAPAFNLGLSKVEVVENQIYFGNNLTGGKINGTERSFRA